MVSQIYPTEIKLNKANSFDTEVPFYDLNLSITNGIVPSKFYDKRDDFNFEIVTFPFLQCIYIAAYSLCESMSYNVSDFNNRNRNVHAPW